MNENVTLQNFVKGGSINKKEHQKKLYIAFYGFAHSIAIRYAHNRTEASVIMNNGFFCAFTRLKDYKETIDFKECLRCLLVQAAIERYSDKVDFAILAELKMSDLDSSDRNLGGGLTYDNYIKMLQQLPHIYRMVFNLFAIEGYEHHKIANLLDIPVSTSETLLINARNKLRSLMSTTHFDYPATGLID